MATHFDIDQFYFGESVEFDFFGKDRNGAVLGTPASQIITMNIGKTEKGAAEVSVSSATSAITLVDAETGKWSANIPHSTLSSLSEGKRYYYMITSNLSGDDPTVQAHGRFILKKAII